MTTDTTYWGIDCGSSEIKVVAISSDGKILHKFKKRTLFPLSEHVRLALKGDGAFIDPLDGKSNIRVKPGHHITATGYGRAHIDFANDRLTEIKAHYLGIEHQLASSLKPRQPYTIIDIGGQDSKVIVVKNGMVEHFVMNRKCAAGTGSFIEELANRLEIDLSKLTELDKKHDSSLTLNSYCTVFAATEVIKILMNGEKVENLIHALYESVVKRVLEMAPITSDTIVFSGGVLFHHVALHAIFENRLADKKFLIAPDAQFCGAIGAAIEGRRQALLDSPHP